MRKANIPQVKVIDAHSALDYEEQFNRVMREVGHLKPQFRQDTTNPFLCFIYYEVENEPVPETLLDEFTIQGRIMQCGNCPYFFLQEDKRMKARCLLHHWVIDPERSCCEEYLAEVKASERGMAE